MCVTVQVTVLLSLASFFLVHFPSSCYLTINYIHRPTRSITPLDLMQMILCCDDACNLHVCPLLHLGPSYRVVVWHLEGRQPPNEGLQCCSHCQALPCSYLCLRQQGSLHLTPSSPFTKPFTIRHAQQEPVLNTCVTWKIC